MAQIYSNFMSGTVTDNPLFIASTTVNSAGFASLPTVAGTDFMWLTLDPEGVNGLPEIVKVTAHGAAATVITVVRAQQSSAARQHPVSSTWAHAVTSTDLNDLPHQFFTGKGDSVWAAAAGQTARLAATGTDGLVIVSDTTQATGSKWAQVGTAGLTDASVTAAKLAVGVGGIPVFTNAAARDAAIPSPTQGMMCFLISTGRVYIRSASAWRETAIADSQSTVRQYRADASGTVHPNTATTTLISWTTESVDTDAMLSPPFTTFALPEGVWSVQASMILALNTGAASNASYNGGMSGLILEIVTLGLIKRSTFAFVTNNNASSTSYFYTSADLILPMTTGQVVQVDVTSPQAISVVGTVTQTVSGTLQLTRIG